jgi:DNA-binding CsgD family transcriptional regulator
MSNVGRIIANVVLRDDDADSAHILMQQIPMLTRSELRVAVCIAKGMTARQTAEAFGTSERTIENHRYRIRKKLGVESSSALRNALTKTETLTS